MICFFNEYREDYFDVKTGEVSVWITNDLKEYWFEKPSFDYSPKTGKEIRLATREEAEQLKKVKYDKVAKAVPLEQKPTNVTFNQPGLFNFKLKPFQTNGTWLYVPEGLRYSLSTLNDDEQPFVIRYQRGDIIEVRRKNVKIPDRAGPFQIQALEKEISVNLMVSRHK